MPCSARSIVSMLYFTLAAGIPSARHFRMARRRAGLSTATSLATTKAAIKPDPELADQSSILLLVARQGFQKAGACLIVQWCRGSR